MIKSWLSADSDKTFLSNVSVDLIVSAKRILDDTSVPERDELVTNRQFTGMDRTVQPATGLRLRHQHGLEPHRRLRGDQCLRTPRDGTPETG